MRRHFLLLAAVITGSHLSAQSVKDQPDTSSLPLDEVVVTANKYPSKTSHTGKVVTIITREQLERSGGKDLSQVLAEQTGLYIGGANSNPGKDKSIYLRGARVDHTLITIDGVPVYDPSGIGGNFDIRNLALENIERIEILKGSQSTLYGSDAVAGVINIITRQGAAKPLGGYVQLRYGSFDSPALQAGIRGRKGTTDYSAGYSFEKTQGINEAENKSNNPVIDKDGFTRHSFQASLGLRPVQALTIQPVFRYSRIQGDIDQGAFTDELDYTYRQESWQAGLRNELTLGKGKLVLAYNYNHIWRSYLDDSLLSRNGFDQYSTGNYSGGEHFTDLYLQQPLGAELKLVAGADYRRSVSDQSFFSDGLFGSSATTYSGDSLRQKQLGLYAALNWNSKKNINVEAGSRINFHSAYDNHIVYNLNPSWLIHKKVKLFANFSSAYRTPSLYQLYSEYGNRKLNPEAAVSAEAGVQYIAPGNKFTGRITGFSRRVKDVIIFFYDPSTFRAQYINQDKQKDHGLEAEASFNISSGTSIKAFYTYVTGEITTLSNGKDTTYFNLLRRPKSSAGISIGHRISPRLYVSSNLSVFGKREDAYFDSNTFSTIQVTLNGYALWDIYAEYNFLKNRLKAFATLRNITGSRYQEVAGFNTPGFNGQGGLRFNF